MAKNPANQKPQQPKPKPQQQDAAGNPNVVHQLSPSERDEMTKLTQSTDPDVANFGRDKKGERRTKRK